MHCRHRNMVPGESWWFVACNRCGKKSLPHGDGYYYTACGYKGKKFSKEFLSTELDIGEGKDADLPDCSRAVLKKQCIRYLGPEAGVYPYGQVQSTDEDDDMPT